jgi:hypothetical protein
MIYIGLQVNLLQNIFVLMCHASFHVTEIVIITDKGIEACL